MLLDKNSFLTAMLGKLCVVVLGKCLAVWSFKKMVMDPCT